MREIVPQQRVLTPLFIAHEHSNELRMCSTLLDKKPEIVELVYKDLTCGVTNPKLGRNGLTAEQVLRILLLKQMEGYSYDKLTFHLQDSTSSRAFCRLGFKDQPKRTTLIENIGKITHETLEGINLLILDIAEKENKEKGRKVRIDTTVIETNIHNPTDSSLLVDCVRTITNNLEKVKKCNIHFSNHQKRAKKRAMEILNAKNDKQRISPYEDLLQVTRWTVGYATDAIPKLLKWHSLDLAQNLMTSKVANLLEHFVNLAEQVIDQTYKRIFLAEKVPANKKVVSIFEPHTDIIVKKRRETEFGHKICFTFGSSSMVLDCVIEDGNPMDSTLACKMIKRQNEIYDRMPRQAAYDGGFASKENLRLIKKMGVKDVMFHKKCGLKISDMAKSTWVYKQLRKFRAGAEGCISFLKRCFGLGRCRWHSFDGFKANVWASVISANILILSRHMLKPS
jgi:IS5 family transposase